MRSGLLRSVAAVGREGREALAAALCGLGCCSLGCGLKEPVSIPFVDDDILPRVHVVSATGESVCTLAGRYGVAAPALLRANGLRTSGQALARGTRVLLTSEPLHHRVAQGETLAGLARWYGIPVTRLAGENGIRDPDRISADSWLRIPPGARTGCPPTATAVARATAAQPVFAAEPVPEAQPVFDERPTLEALLTPDALLTPEARPAPEAQPTPEARSVAATQPAPELQPTPEPSRTLDAAALPAPEAPSIAAALPAHEAQPASAEEPSYEEARRMLARAQTRYDAADFGEALELSSASLRLLEPHAGGAKADRLRAHASWISGLVYTGLGRTEPAISNFRTALELDPSLADPRLMSPKVRTLVDLAGVDLAAGP